MTDHTVTESTPLHTVTLTTTAKGIVTFEVTVHDRDPEVAATKAGAVLDRLRTQYIATNAGEFYKGAA